MIQVISCTQCGIDHGGMPVTLEYEYEDHVCDSRLHRSSQSHKYHFCSLDCLSQFVNKHPYSLPCYSCHATGNAFGFKENGPCRACGGSGQVPKVKIDRAAQQAQ